VSARRILLVGMMGVGKSTVGRALSEQTGWPYVDNDDLLHADTGMYGAELLERDGVQALRDAEAKVLAEIVERDPPLVAGIAAGVVLRPEDRTRLKEGGFVVWLRARTETLVPRVSADRERAWLQPDPAAALRELAAGRDPLYAEVADLIIDVDEQSTEKVVAEIRRSFE
jgi:shikimate kinase